VDDHTMDLGEHRTDEPTDVEIPSLEELPTSEETSPGDPSALDPSPGDPSATDPAAASETIHPETLRADLERAVSALGEREAEVALLRTSLHEAHDAQASLQLQVVESHRRALLAEIGATVVPELVRGATVQELDASVEGARAAYTRIAEATRAELTTQMVPVGASPRDTHTTSETSTPFERIARGLRR